MSVRPLARTEGSMIAKEIISEDLRKRKAFLWRLLDLITSKIPRKSAEHFMPKSKYDCAELQTFPCNKFPTCWKESSALNTPGNIISMAIFIGAYLLGRGMGLAFALRFRTCRLYGIRVLIVRIVSHMHTR
jgi:hypothetical protein